MGRRERRSVAAGAALAAALVAGALADRATGWVGPAFTWIAHQFYEVPMLAALRRPTQLALVRMHLMVFGIMAASGLLAAPRLTPHGRRWWAVFCAGYAIRAAAWIAGGNLPLVPGDSCHYLETAASVYRGEGAVKHYVESYFIDYPRIREGRGVLDDWATPLWAYTLAGAYRAAGVVPGQSLEASVAVAKGTSFVLNLLALPLLYVFGRRRFGAAAGLGAMAALAVLPVHAIYAGFGLRESQVALTSLLAAWLYSEMAPSNGGRRWAWAIAAGLAAGLAILSRNTAMALVAALGLHGLIYQRRHLLPLMAWATVTLAVIAPWGWATMQEYGKPFFSYTEFFQYNFSWTVHHYQTGNTRAAEFYTASNAPEILRVKVKALLIIAGYSAMIVGWPLVAGFVRKLRQGPCSPGRAVDRMVVLIALAFVGGTLANVADVTQVAQLGRYYLPLFCLMLPTAAAGLGGWIKARVDRSAWPAAGLALVALLWADPTWAYDASWFVRPYQLHWPGLRAAGDWIEAHPADIPPEARVMTWFPWELRVASDRTTILLPRNYNAVTIAQAAERYGVTHVLWGSFEPPPHVDPETFGAYLERARLGLGLTDARELYRSPPGTLYPVRLYRWPRQAVPR